MRKQIKRYGNSLIINFTVEDQVNYNIIEGQVYDVELCLVNKQKESKGLGNKAPACNSNKNKEVKNQWSNQK